METCGSLKIYLGSDNGNGAVIEIWSGPDNGNRAVI